MNESYSLSDIFSTLHTPHNSNSIVDSVDRDSWLVQKNVFFRKSEDLIKIL